jgi:hypothetical protein
VVVLLVGAVCDQKNSKFFVSSGEESMAGHVGETGVYYKLGKGIMKGSMVGAGVIWRQRELLPFSGAFKIYANLWEGKHQVISVP